MAGAEVTEVRRPIDGLRRNPRTHPDHGRREYSDRAREVAVALAGMIQAGRGADVVPLARRAVERVLREDLADEAWSTAPGEPDQVSASQWLQLISLRESGYPADVLGPLSRLIELGVEQAVDKYRYPKAVKALRRLREDYERAGDAAGFGVYLAGLRERQRRKYSIIAKVNATFGREGS